MPANAPLDPCRKPRRHKFLPGLVLILGLVCTASGCKTLLGRAGTKEITTARELSMRGLDAMQRGEWSEAEKLFGEAIATCPVDERSRWHYAETLWHRGAKGEAIKYMRESLELSDGNPTIAVRLGEMYLDQQNLIGAAQEADNAISQQSELPRAWALHGDVHLQQGQLQAALASYHRALSYQEHFPRVQLAIADLYLREDRADRALGTLTALAEQYPPSNVPPNVLYQRGLALKDLHRYRDAIENLTEASRRGLATADVLYQLGEAQLAAGDPASAQLAITDALRKSPSHPGALQLQARLSSRDPGLAARVQR